MSNLLTLDKLREDIEKEFAPVKVGLSDGTEVTLRNLLRLNKKDREAVLELLGSLDGLDKAGEEQSPEAIEQMLDVIHEILVLVAKDKGRKLVNEIGDDLALTMKVLEAWTEATQPGEARNSPA